MSPVRLALRGTLPQPVISRRSSNWTAFTVEFYRSRDVDVVTQCSYHTISVMTGDNCDLYQRRNGKELRAFEGHTKDVRRVAISPDGKQLLSASFDGSVRLWDLQTGKELKKFDGPGNFVESVAFTPDGKRAVCSYGPGSAEAVYDQDPRVILKLWDLATGKEIKQFKGHGGPVLCLALSRDGSQLLSGSADGTMRLWMPK